MAQKLIPVRQSFPIFEGTLEASEIAADAPHIFAGVIPIAGGV